MDRLALLYCGRGSGLNLGLLGVVLDNLGGSTRLASDRCVISGLLCGRVWYFLLLIQSVLGCFGLLSGLLFFSMFLGCSSILLSVSLCLGLLPHSLSLCNFCLVLSPLSIGLCLKYLCLSSLLLSSGGLSAHFVRMSGFLGESLFLRFFSLEPLSLGLFL